MDPSAWLITGASSGLGYALAKFVLEQRDRAVITAPGIEATAELTSRYPQTARALRLDVTDAEQREIGVNSERVLLRQQIRPGGGWRGCCCASAWEAP